MDEEKKEADLIGEEKIKKYLEALLQKMYDGTLTPEELEAFFPKD